MMLQRKEINAQAASNHQIMTEISLYCCSEFEPLPQTLFFFIFETQSRRSYIFQSLRSYIFQSRRSYIFQSINSVRSNCLSLKCLHYQVGKMWGLEVLSLCQRLNFYICKYHNFPAYL